MPRPPTGRQVLSFRIRPEVLDRERRPGQTRTDVVRELIAEAIQARRSRTSDTR
jgi:hypothetical protein